MRHVTKRQIESTIKAVQKKWPGMWNDIRVIDHREYGESWKLELSPAYQIADEMNASGLMPKGTFMEPINYDYVGVYYI